MNKINKRLVEVLSFSFIFTWLYLLAMRGLMLYDDYAVYNPALSVARGKILYKEAYTQYGPIMAYIQAAFIKLFGERILSVRLSAILFYMAAFGMYYYVFKKFLPYWLVLISAVCLALLEPSGYSVFHSWSSIYSLTFEMVLIILFINYIETRKHIYVILSGIDAGIIFFCRQSAGIVFIIAIILLYGILGIILKKDASKNILEVLLGILIVIGGFALYFYANGCLSKYFNDALVNQFGLLKHFVNDYTAKSIEENTLIPVTPTTPTIQTTPAIQTTPTIQTAPATSMMPNDTNNYMPYISNIIMLLNCLFPLRLIGIYFLLPFFSVADFIIFLHKVLDKERDDICNVKIFIISFLCIASWHQYFPLEGDLFHTYWAAFPMMALLPLNIYMISKALLKRNIGIATCFIMLIMLSPTLYNRINHSVNMMQEHNVTPTKEYEWAQGIYLTNEESDFLKDYYSYINGLKEQYNDLIIYNYTFLYLPECEVVIDGRNASAILNIKKEGQYKKLDKYMSFRDSFPMLCEFYMELVVAD